MELSECQKLLVFGGTFDPPHVAHVVLPMLAMEAAGCDGVAYIPAARSPHKLGQAPTAAEHRVAMLRLALAGARWATVLTDEIDRFTASGGEPSYTIDTLMALKPRLRPGGSMRLLIGTDQMLAFDRWREPKRIIELAEPVVMPRPPHSRATALAALPASAHAEWAPRILDLPVIDLSATQLRARLAAGQPVTGMVHPAVTGYIVEHGLYGAGSGW